MVRAAAAPERRRADISRAVNPPGIAVGEAGAAQRRAEGRELVGIPVVVVVAERDQSASGGAIASTRSKFR